MDEFDEQYLYQTALYNGLTDTTYPDTGVLKSALGAKENKPPGGETNGPMRRTES